MTLTIDHFLQKEHNNDLSLGRLDIQFVFENIHAFKCIYNALYR